MTRIIVSVDIVIFGYSPELSSLRVLLVHRGTKPFKGMLALPGGRMLDDETTDDAASRILRDRTGLQPARLEQLYTFSGLKRDPRSRAVSVAYFALVPMAEFHPIAGCKTLDSNWYEIEDVGELAFDHNEILRVARERVQGKIVYAPLGFDLLPKTFTITELRSLYETVLDRQIEPANFRRKILKMGILVETDEVKETGHRPATTYRFDEKAYQRLSKQGWVFEI